MIEGFTLGEHKSDGEITCDSTVGESHIIRKGADVFWLLTNVEYDEWRPCCRKHAKAEAAQVY